MLLRLVLEWETRAMHLPQAAAKLTSVAIACTALLEEVWYGLVYAHTTSFELIGASEASKTLINGPPNLSNSDHQHLIMTSPVSQNTSTFLSNQVHQDQKMYLLLEIQPEEFPASFSERKLTKRSFRYTPARFGLTCRMKRLESHGSLLCLVVFASASTYNVEAHTCLDRKTMIGPHLGRNV